MRGVLKTNRSFTALFLELKSHYFHEIQIHVSGEEEQIKKYLHQYRYCLKNGFQKGVKTSSISISFSPLNSFEVTKCCTSKNELKDILVKMLE